MWSYLDHKLKLSVKMSKWRTETEKLCISEVISYVIILTMIRKTRLLPNDIPQSYLSSIVPTFIKEKPNWNHHFSVSSVVWRHVDSTVWFGWCFEEAVPLRFSKCNHNFFYGHSLIKNSNWEWSKGKHRDRQVVYVRSISGLIMMTMIIKKGLISNDIPQSYHSSIIPTSIIERPNSINHFSVSSVVCRHVDLTVWLGWCFEEDFSLCFFQCNDTLLCGQTLITNSSWEWRWVKEGQRRTSCVSQK